jgi:hypothetical protein
MLGIKIYLFLENCNEIFRYRELFYKNGIYFIDKIKIVVYDTL